MFCESSHFFHVLSDSKHISIDRNVIRCGGLQARFIQDMKSFARAKSQNVIFTRGSGEKDSVKIILISLEALIR